VLLQVFGDFVSIPADAAIVADNLVKLVAAVGAVVVSVAHNPLNILGGMAPAVESAAYPFLCLISCSSLMAIYESASPVDNCIDGCELFHLAKLLATYGQGFCGMSVQLDANLLATNFEGLVAVQFAGTIA
jgi:hypothetical protein